MNAINIIRRRPFTVWFSLAAAVLTSFPVGRAAAADPVPLTVAVLDFQTTAEGLAGKGADVAGLLDAQLAGAAPDATFVERQELAKVLGEEELGISGTVNPDTAAKIGALTGAKVLVTGRLFGMGDRYFLAAKIIGTETSRVYAETASFNDLGALDKGTAELAREIASDLHRGAGTFVAPVEDPGARLDRLKKLVAGKSLPSVSVNVTEQHITRPVIDPAVQTELQLVLQQLGFEVIDPAPGGKTADVEISGAAFSEAAGRHGNLITCRARVEIKAVRSADHKLLAVDRQVDVAVDVAEEVAGKGALENAADKLVERLVPKIVAAE